MRFRPSLLLAACLLVLLPACTGGTQDEPERTVTGAGDRGAGDAGDAPAESPTPTEPPPQPLRVQVTDIHILDMDNASILGTGPTRVDNQAVLEATRGAADALEAYLNAQFIDPDSRFSAAPVTGLLTGPAQAALTDADRAGLGEANVWAERTSGEPVAAQATVLAHGATVHQVRLGYEARVRVRAPGQARGRTLVQHGDIVFVPREHGWFAQAADVTLDGSALPPPPPRSAAELDPSVPGGVAW